MHGLGDRLLFEPMRQLNRANIRYRCGVDDDTGFISGPIHVVGHRSEKSNTALARQGLHALEKNRLIFVTDDTEAQWNPALGSGRTEEAGSGIRIIRNSGDHRVKWPVSEHVSLARKAGSVVFTSEC